MSVFRIAAACGRRLVVTMWLVALWPATGLAAGPSYPATPARGVDETLHGQTVHDDYRWLETTDQPEVQAWVAAQNALTRQVLGPLPQRRALQRELKAMQAGGKVTRRDFVFVAGRLFAIAHQPPKAQPLLVVLRSPTDPRSQRVVLDPNRLDASGNTAIDWYAPSRDGRFVAVSLSQGGSEDGHLRVIEVATGRLLPDVVPRVSYPTAGGSAAWSADGRGFFYTRYPQGEERAPEDINFYQQIYYHRLGTPAASDEYALGRDFPRIAEIALQASDDGRHVLADVSNGDGGEHGFYLRRPDGHWLPIAGFDEGFRSAVFGRDGRLYALCTKGSPRGRVVALPLDAPEGGFAAATLVVPEGEAVIEGVLPTASRLYVAELAGGPSRLRMLTLDGRSLGSLSAPGDTDIVNLTLGERLAGDAILYGSQSFVRAQAWYHHDPARTGRDGRPVSRRTTLSDAPGYAVDGGLPDAEVVREFAVSKDGTRVPVNIVKRRGLKLDGSHPVLLSAYGGYGISMRPWFSRQTVLWLRHGGVFALANLRGGGEYGEAWHVAGNLERKQNVFDDFLACAEHLIARGYTRPERLAIEGGSNGGLLMGAALVQRPELFRAVVSEVGIYDMVRVELTPNGSFNTTEFGSVQDETQFRALYAYSPLHHVQDGTRYPAVLLTTGANDGRVAPWMSFKMAARLQAANPDSLAQGRPVLLRVAADAGHGIGSSLSSVLEEETDLYGFLFSQLGMR